MPPDLRLLVFIFVFLCSPAWGEPTDTFLKVPGTVVSQSPNPAATFIASPSIAILPDGAYVACHDTYGTPPIIFVFRSVDRGLTWTKTSEFPGQWANLFVHQGQLYLMGTTAANGSMVIRRSVDGGLSWTNPTNASNGLIRSGAYSTAPVPMVVHQGRIWRAFEDLGGGGDWPKPYRAFLISAPVEGDLLAASNWTTTTSVPSSSSWLGSKFNGWLEGNVVVNPQGHLVDVIRADTKAGIPEQAAVIDFGEDGAAGTFDPEARPAENEGQQSGFIGFPGGAKKFTIRRDPNSGEYWTLVNTVLPSWSAIDPVYVRNTVSLMRSIDLVHWETRCHVIFHPDIYYHACQYLDWQFDGDDIIAVGRTSWMGRTYHDANFLTFHRIANFRSLSLDNSVPTDGSISWPFPGFQISGAGFVPGLLENGVTAYANRNYLWDEVPVAFANSLITRVAGGIQASMKLKAVEAGRAYVAIAVPPNAGGFSGWSSVGQSFCSNDAFRTRLWLYQRDFAVGEEMQIPQTTWSGTLVVMPPSTGPVGWWRCESNFYGTAIADELYSFHGKPSAPSPPVAEGPGVSGLALHFQAGQHVDVGNNFSLTRVPFTISFWMKLAAGNTTYGVPLSKMSTSSLDGYVFEVNPVERPGKIRFMATSVDSQLNSSTLLNDGSWHHVGVTSALNGDMILYIDGKEQDRCPAPQIMPTTASLRFGARTNNSAAIAGFEGWLDEIQIHFRILSSTELTAMTTTNGNPSQGGAAPQIIPHLEMFPDHASLTWNAIPGKSYDVFRSTTLQEGSWYRIQTITTQDMRGEFLEYEPSERAFFRIEMLP